MRPIEPALILSCLLGLSACGSDTIPLAVADEPPAPECIRPEEPRTYEIFFVIDVSGSMGPFLTDVRNELVAFADNLPEYDAEGRRVRVDYYLIGFVNDWKWFGGGRMTSVIALQAAFDEAIAGGRSNHNLTVNSFNAEQEENLLDALSQVVAQSSNAEAKMVMIATDAPFVESPEVLSENLPVQTSYASLRADLESNDFRVHAFTERQLDGLTRKFKSHEALTTLPGSSVHTLDDLRGARENIRSTLADIAAQSACN